MSVRVRVLLITLSLLLLLITIPRFPPLGHASINNTTVLLVTPSRIAPPSSQVFSVNVNLTLAAGESVGAYDIILKTVNLGSGDSPLNITGIQAGNIFPKDQYAIVANCVNGVGQGCGANDGGGIAHSAEAYGLSVTGPLNVTVFTVQFKILRTGSEVLELDNDVLVSGSNAAQVVPHATENGVFSSVGLKAYFNVLTAIPIVNRPVRLDASPSFDPTNATINTLKLNYTWSFDDGNVTLAHTPSALHTFTSVRSYNVMLNVTDGPSQNSSFHRTIDVGSALGGIQLDINDQNGNSVQRNVTISLLNGSQVVETITKVPSNPSRPVLLLGLKEGSYGLAFSGAGITASSKSESVMAGWTTIDIVYLTVQYPPSPPKNDSPDLRLYIVFGILGTGGALGVFAVIKRRALKRKERGS